MSQVWQASRRDGLVVANQAMLGPDTFAWMRCNLAGRVLGIAAFGMDAAWQGRYTASSGSTEDMENAIWQMDGGAGTIMQQE